MLVVARRTPEIPCAAGSQAAKSPPPQRLNPALLLGSRHRIDAVAHRVFSRATALGSPTEGGRLQIEHSRLQLPPAKRMPGSTPKPINFST
jgi:hypothetical protein